MNTPTEAESNRMTKFSVFLSADLHQRLEELSVELGSPKGEITRRALAFWLQRAQQNVRPS